MSIKDARHDIPHLYVADADDNDRCQHVMVDGKGRKRSRAGDLDFYRQALFTKTARQVNIGHSVIAEASARLIPRDS